MTSTTILALELPKYVISATTTTPPAAAANDDAYIVPTGASGAWSGSIGDVAISDGFGGWVFVTPEKGDKVAVGDTSSFVFFDTTWKPVGPDHDWYKNGTTAPPDSNSVDISRKGRLIIRDSGGSIVTDINPDSTLKMNQKGNILFESRDLTVPLYVQRKSNQGIFDIDIDNSGAVIRKRLLTFPANTYEEYDIKTVAGLTRTVKRTVDIMPDQMTYGHQAFKYTAYVYIDPVNGSDANPGDTRFRPVQTFAAVMNRLIAGRVNYIMFMGDATIDTSQTYQLQEAASCIALMGATADGASFQKRTITIAGNGRVLSGFGNTIIRIYNIDIVEDAGRVATEIFYSALNINMYMGTSTHLNALSSLLSSTGVSFTFFYNTQLTPGKIFRGIPAGGNPTWRYSNSNLTTG